MKTAVGDGPGPGTHLELESKLRACPVLGSPPLGRSDSEVPRRGLCCFAANLLDKGRARLGGVVLVVLPPEMAGGQPLVFGDKYPPFFWVV